MPDLEVVFLKLRKAIGKNFTILVNTLTSYCVCCDFKLSNISFQENKLDDVNLNSDGLYCFKRTEGKLYGF